MQYKHKEKEFINTEYVVWTESCSGRILLLCCCWYLHMNNLESYIIYQRAKWKNTIISCVVVSRPLAWFIVHSQSCYQRKADL